ncbi:MAG: VWA domain-containing protein [Proteobacteria bacterium]|jgi:hypothetical protein|nr:VWA domain-containing protein [Pseudomonadota bacterium]
MRIVCFFCLLAACKSERDLFELTGEDIWYQADNNEVDLLWVVDNSNSMKEEQVSLADGFSTFIQEMEETGTDFHLGVITTSFDTGDLNRGKLLGDPPVITQNDDYVAAFKSRVQVGGGGSQKEKGLEAATYAVSPVMTTGPNSGFLRPDAQLLILVVSDEDDCSDGGVLDNDPPEACYTKEDELIPVTEFVVELRELKASADLVMLSAIVGPLETEAAGCNDTWPGHRYMEVAKYTGGQTANICETEWGNMLWELGLNASGVASSFKTSRAAQPDSIEVYVDDVEIEESASNGWTYDSDTWYLHFHQTAIPPRGSEIKCTYEILAGAEEPG